MSTPEPYTSAEHDANLDQWMAATDKERSEAFYTLHSLCGSDAMAGDVRQAKRLRRLVARLQAGGLS